MPSIRLDLKDKRPTILVAITTFSDISEPSHHFHEALLDTSSIRSSVSEQLLSELDITYDTYNYSLHIPLLGDETGSVDNIQFHTLKPVSLHPVDPEQITSPIILGLDIIKDNTFIISGNSMIFSF